MTDKRPERATSGEMATTRSDERDAAAFAGKPASGSDMQALIGRQLRAVYDDIAKQPVPDRFIELMKQLDTANLSR